MNAFGPMELAVVALVFLAMLGTGIWRWILRRRSVVDSLGDRGVVARLVGEDLYAIPRRRIAAVCLSGLAIAAALLSAPSAALPTDAARDVVLVLDVSNSMLVEDVAANRLERLREIASEVVAASAADRIGVVAFAGEAVVLSPPTRDLGSVRMYLDALGPEVAGQSGSAAGGGIRQAAALLAAGPRRPGGRVAVLIGDGEPVGAEDLDDAIDAATRAAALGVTVHTIGIGSIAGGPVPDIDPESGARVGYKRDPQTGEVAVSRQHPEVLREVSRVSSGTYVDGGDQAGVARLLTSLSRDTAAADRPLGAKFGPYLGFVVMALLLLGFDAVHEARRSARRGAR